MKWNTYYTLTKEYLDYPVGTQVRVHDWNDDCVQISINGSLEWLPNVVFSYITTV